MKAPFSYFGGKRRIAAMVWERFGNVKHYIEPFFGSGAVLLARPDYQAGVHIETVCDADGLLCNVWRALKAAPDQVAEWCDWPVNHADLSARRRVLLAAKAALLERLIADDGYYEAKLAGYWVWAASCWIGTGLTRPNALPRLALGKIPNITSGHGSGTGVHALGQIPNVASEGGSGVHALTIQTAARQPGMPLDAPFNTNIYRWFRALAERLRYVRVVCGDWSRVCGGDWQDSSGIVGIFLDPPYLHAVGRHEEIYEAESADVANAAREWALAQGDRPSYRIALCGYEGEHKMPASWECAAWKGGGGYGNQAKARGRANSARERVWFSPHCLEPQRKTSLFDEKGQGAYAPCLRADSTHGAVRRQ